MNYTNQEQKLIELLLYSYSKNIAKKYMVFTYQDLDLDDILNFLKFRSLEDKNYCQNELKSTYETISDYITNAPKELFALIRSRRIEVNSKFFEEFLNPKILLAYAVMKNYYSIFNGDRAPYQNELMNQIASDLGICYLD